MVSVIIPVIRESSAVRTIKSLPRTLSGVEVIAEKDTHHVGCIEMVHRLTKKASFDIVVFLGDDCTARPEMIPEGLRHLTKFRDKIGIVGLKTYPGNQIAHWMFHKKILSCFEGGRLLSPAYHHGFSDSELYLFAIRMGLWGCTDSIVIDHYHPVNGHQWDDGYDRAYSGWVLKDSKMFQKRTGICPNINIFNSYKTPDILVRCNKYIDCFHQCHHAKPHVTEMVTFPGARYNSFDLDISCCQTALCTEYGTCDQGLVVRCESITKGIQL